MPNIAVDPEDLLRVEIGSLYPVFHPGGERLQRASWQFSGKGQQTRCYGLTALRLLNDLNVHPKVVADQLHHTVDMNQSIILSRL